MIAVQRRGQRQRREGHRCAGEAAGDVGAAADSLSRRTFIERAGILGGLVALAQVSWLLGPRGLLDEARAVDLDDGRGALPGGPSYTSILTLADELATPQPRASTLAGARNVVIQDFCGYPGPIDHQGFRKGP